MSLLNPAKKNSNLGYLNFSNWTQNEDGSYGIDPEKVKEEQKAKEEEADLTSLATVSAAIRDFDWEAHKRGEPQPPKDPNKEKPDFSYIDELYFSDIRINLDPTFSAGPRVKPSSNDMFFNADDGDFFEKGGGLTNDGVKKYSGNNPILNPDPVKKDPKDKSTTERDDKKGNNDNSFDPGYFGIVSTAVNNTPAENERSTGNEWPVKIASVIPAEVSDVLKKPNVQYALIGVSVFSAIYYYRNYKNKKS